MFIKETEFLLKDGRIALLRSPCEADAEEMLHFIIKASGKKKFGERAWFNSFSSEETTSILKEVSLI